VAGDEIGDWQIHLKVTLLVMGGGGLMLFAKWREREREGGREIQCRLL
jgi:hypothetical protein